MAQSRAGNVIGFRSPALVFGAALGIVAYAGHHSRGQPSTDGAEQLQCTRQAFDIVAVEAITPKAAPGDL